MKTIDECACGIARIDCDYHAPEAVQSTSAMAQYAFIFRNGSWEQLRSGELPWSGRYLTADGLYIHTLSHSILVDEEPA